MTVDSQLEALSRYNDFSKEEWSNLRGDTPLTLSESDLAALRGVNENVSLDEVVHAYLPLARLLILYFYASQNLFKATAEFLGRTTAKVPYIIGLAGSVAVGKSTTSRILRELLARMPSQPKVDLISTDGFLFPTKVLQEKGLMERKGFPESYDIHTLVRFLQDVKSGRHNARVPVYSHVFYDIVPNRFIEVDQPDIVIIEGLNILQSGSTSPNPHARIFVSDFTWRMCPLTSATVFG